MEAAKRMKKSLGHFVILSLFVLGLLCFYQPINANASTLYGVYDNKNEYLYTIDENEKDHLIESGWTSLGVVCTLPDSSANAVYRLYNTKTTQHLYTVDESEIDKLTGEGWIKEGIAFYTSSSNIVPVYRFFNPNNGYHAFGTEKDIADFEALGWTKEGVAFYGVTDNVNETSLATNASTSQYTDTARQLKTLLLNQLNEYRAENGLSTLQHLDISEQVADIRAQECSIYWSHTRPDGRRWSTTYHDLGYSFSSVGENLCHFYYSITEQDIAEQADYVMTSWKNSPGHNANMLKSKWNYVGIGIYFDNNNYNDLYATQEFYQ